MTRKRTVLAVVLFGVGALAMVVRVDSQLPFATQQIFIAGLVVLGVGGLYIWSERTATSASPPVPEGPAELPRPGSEIEDQLETLSQPPVNPSATRTWKETRDDVSTHLRSLAVSTLAERYNLTDDQAAHLLDAGTWSDNPDAVGFFAPENAEDRSVLRRRASMSETGTQAKQVVDELGKIEEGEMLLPDSAVLETDSGEETNPSANESAGDNGGDAT
jgi:hypothetical protein